MIVIDWLRENWKWATPTLVFLLTLAKLIQQWFELSRQRMLNRNLRKENAKLDLEIEHLQNRPEVVAERRDIYNALRELLNQLLVSFEVRPEDIAEIHRINHDAKFRFPPEICEQVEQLIPHVVTLHVYQSRTYNLDIDASDEHAAKRTEASLELVSFHEAMSDLFQPYLSL